MELIGRPWQIQCTYLNIRKKGKIRGKKKKQQRKGKLTHGDKVMKGMISSTIVKAKGCGIVYKEVDKAIDDNIAQSGEEVMEVTLHDNMFTCLHCSLVTWAVSRGVRKEVLLIFANEGMTCGHVSKLYM